MSTKATTTNKPRTLRERLGADHDIIDLKVQVGDNRYSSSEVLDQIATTLEKSRNGELIEFVDY